MAGTRKLLNNIALIAIVFSLVKVISGSYYFLISLLLGIIYFYYTYKSYETKRKCIGDDIAKFGKLHNLSTDVTFFDINLSKALSFDTKNRKGILFEENRPLTLINYDDLINAEMEGGQNNRIVFYGKTNTIGLNIRKGQAAAYKAQLNAIFC